MVLFYSYATPSGVESISHNFLLPPVATRVGHFPETITDGYNGYLAEPENIEDMARQLARSIDDPHSPRTHSGNYQGNELGQLRCSHHGGVAYFARNNASARSSTTSLPAR